MSTASQSLITVVIDGEPWGTFDSRSGGETTADITKHRPGGMGTEKAYPSLPTTGDVTVGRVYERERDVAKVAAVRHRTGRAAMSITEQPLDADGIPWGSPTTWTGLLSSVTDGDADSTSNDVRMLELVCAAETVS